LRLRRRLEEQAQMELAEKQRLLALEQARADEVRRELERHDGCRAALQHSGLVIQALIDAEQYREALARTLFHHQQRAAEAMAAVEASREALLQRRTDREALERLRERRLEEYRQEERRVEQQTLDESSGLRWRRRFEV
jgi:flagellar FliJ protein